MLFLHLFAQIKQTITFFIEFKDMDIYNKKDKTEKNRKS